MTARRRRARNGLIGGLGAVIAAIATVNGLLEQINKIAAQKVNAAAVARAVGPSELDLRILSIEERLDSLEVNR